MSLHKITGVRFFLVTTIIVGAAAFILLLFFRGFDAAFQLWHIPTYGVPFLDLSFITGSAESFAHGFDPAILNPGDPIQRTFNYPRIWYVFFGIGMTKSWTIPLGIAIIVLFLVSVVVFPGKLRGLSAFLLILALLSPAIMLGFARVNTDLLIFVAMAMSLLLVEQYTIGAFVILLIAIIFKIIPILGVGFFLDKNRSNGLKFMLGAIVATALYFVLTLRDMIFIYNHTQKGYLTSYGLAVLTDSLRRFVQDPAVIKGPLLFYQAVSRSNQGLLRFPYFPYLVAILILLVMAYLGSRSPGHSETDDIQNLRAFWMGAGMYVGTFLIGNNWDYRLIFLLFTLPQLCEWVIQRRQPIRTVAILAMLLIFGSLWHALIQDIMADIFALGGYYSFLLNQVTNWALYAVLILIICSSFPRWIFQDIGSVFRDLPKFLKSTSGQQGNDAQN